MSVSREEQTMRYMIMAFGDQSALAGRSAEWIETMIDFMQRIDGELADVGELVFEQGLADPSTGRTVGVQDGRRTVDAYPFLDPRQSLAGFWIVDVEGEGRAIEIAARMAEAAETRFEVRACADAPD